MAAAFLAACRDPARFVGEFATDTAALDADLNAAVAGAKDVATAEATVRNLRQMLDVALTFGADWRVAIRSPGCDAVPVGSWVTNGDGVDFSMPGLGLPHVWHARANGRDLEVLLPIAEREFTLKLRRCTEAR